MKTLSFAPLEAIPSQRTLAKLILCDRVIFADNLAYNKRHKYNAVQINTEASFSFPIEKNPKLYNDAHFDLSQKFQEKLIHIVKKQFGHQDYAPFIQDDIISLIENETSLIGIHQAWLKLLEKHLNTENKYRYASELSRDFDIIELSNSNKNSILLLDPVYKDFADSKKISYQLFNYNFVQPNNYHRLIKKNDSTLQLFFEFGPYLSRLFKIA